MNKPKATLADPKYKKWNGKILIWYQQREKWLKDKQITSFLYYYKDMNGLVNELEISKSSLNEPGVLFKPIWKTKSDGARYRRPAFFMYKISDVQVLSHKIIIKGSNDE